MTTDRGWDPDKSEPLCLVKLYVKPRKYYALTKTDTNMPTTIVDTSTSTCLNRVEVLEVDVVALG